MGTNRSRGRRSSAYALSQSAGNVRKGLGRVRYTLAQGTDNAVSTGRLSDCGAGFDVVRLVGIGANRTVGGPWTEEKKPGHGMQGDSPVNSELLIERLFPALVSGDRTAARQLIDEALDQGLEAETLAHEILWPTMEMLSDLHRSDQLTTLAHHYATRLLRNLVDQVQPRYECHAPLGRSVLMFCGQTESEELEAQLTADIAEASGYEVAFGGGGIANDEILEEVNARRPDVLLMFASSPSDAPNIRLLIDHIRGINACPDMQIVVGGGVFNRAEGLAQEIGADLWARSPEELVHVLQTRCERRATPEQRTVGRTRKMGSPLEHNRAEAA